MAWIAGIVAAALATALGGWLTMWGSSLGSDSGPAIAAVVDIDPTTTLEYALADPVTSAADRVALLSGTASPASVMTLIGRHGGVPVAHLDVTLVLTGQRSSLRIVNIQPRPLPARRPPTAAFLSFPSAGTVPVIPVTARLDAAVPVLESGSRPYFDTREIDLRRDERESFRVSFLAAAGYHVFNLLVTYVVGGQQHYLTIRGPDDGTFRLAGAATDYRDYRNVYVGTGANQFEIASRSQECGLFPSSRGCRHARG